MKRPDDIRSDLIWLRAEIKPGSTHTTPDGITMTVTAGSSMWAVANPEAHAEGCHVYWGSHGCSRPKGHDGDHWCDCCTCENHPDPDSGCVAGPPYYGPDTLFYGEDADGS